MKALQHLCAMVILTIVMGLIYAHVQQSYPFNAGNPHLQEKVSGMTKMVFVSWLLCMAVILINWLVTFYHYKKYIHDAK